MEMKEYNTNFSTTLIYDKFNILPFWVSNCTLKFEYAGQVYPNILIQLTPLYSGIPEKSTTKQTQNNNVQNTIGGILTDTFCFGMITPPTATGTPDQRGFEKITYDFSNPINYGDWWKSTDCYYRWVQSNYDKYASTSRLVYLRDVIAMSSQKDTSTLGMIASVAASYSVSDIPISVPNAIRTGSIAGLYFGSISMLNSLNYCNLLWGTLPPQNAKTPNDCAVCGLDICNTSNGIQAGTCKVKSEFINQAASAVMTANSLGGPIAGVGMLGAMILTTATDITNNNLDNICEITAPSITPIPLPDNARRPQLSYINNEQNDADPTGIVSLVARGVTNIMFYVYPETDVDDEKDSYLYNLFNQNDNYNNKIFNNNPVDNQYTDYTKLLRSIKNKDYLYFSQTVTTCQNNFYNITAGNSIKLLIVYVQGSYYNSLSYLTPSIINSVYNGVYNSLTGLEVKNFQHNFTLSN
jgi:hypothetical protein